MTNFVRGAASRFLPCMASVLAVMLAAVLAMPTAGRAQDEHGYPTHAVRIVVPYGPGGIADVTMRMVANKLSDHFGQQFFVDNRPGAGGIIGMKAVQEAAPDGYTLVMIGGGLTIAKALFKKLPYDIETDFVPISTTASYGLLIATKAGSPYKTAKDIIAYAKANPGKLNVGTINAGSTQHLAATLFDVMADIKVTLIPYKTTPDLALAVLRRDIDIAFEYYPGLQSPIAEGRMIAVATTAATRASNLPNVPTVIESGLPGYDVTSWNGIAAPRGTSDDIVFVLNREVTEALKSPDVQKFALDAGMDARGLDSKDLENRIKSDVQKWTQLIAKAGIARR